MFFTFGSSLKLDTNIIYFSIDIWSFCEYLQSVNFNIERQGKFDISRYWFLGTRIFTKIHMDYVCKICSSFSKQLTKTQGMVRVVGQNIRVTSPFGIHYCPLTSNHFDSLKKANKPNFYISTQRNKLYAMEVNYGKRITE